MNDCKNKNYISEKVYHKIKANANIYSEILFVFLLTNDCSGCIM